MASEESGRKYSNEQLHFLSEAYDVLYNKAQELLEEYNPCEIINGECISPIYDFEPCCSTSCKHTSSTGCTVRNLKCKMFLCWDVIVANPEMRKRWNRLRKIYENHLIYVYPWKTKEEALSVYKEKTPSSYPRRICL
jgi:hypothetical protein